MGITNIKMKKDTIRAVVFGMTWTVIMYIANPYLGLVFGVLVGITIIYDIRRDSKILE